MNTVFITLLISLITVWVFGSTDFAINITACWLFFIVLELINKKYSGKTISQKFWIWKDIAPKWEVVLVVLSIAYIGVYFALHLMYRI